MACGLTFAIGPWNVAGACFQNYLGSSACLQPSPTSFKGGPH